MNYRTLFLFLTAFLFLSSSIAQAVQIDKAGMTTKVINPMSDKISKKTSKSERVKDEPTSKVEAGASVGHVKAGEKGSEISDGVVIAGTPANLAIKPSKSNGIDGRTVFGF